MKNRKFTVAILLIFAGILFLPLCLLNKDLIEVSVPYYTFLGVIGSGFFAANVGEHMTKSKGAVNANIPDSSQPI